MFDESWELLPPQLEHFWNVDVFQRPLPPKLPPPPHQVRAGRPRRFVPVEVTGDVPLVEAPILIPNNAAVTSEPERRALLARLEELDQIDEAKRATLAIARKHLMGRMEELDHVEGQVRQMQGLPVEVERGGSPPQQPAAFLQKPNGELEDVRTSQVEEVYDAAFAHLMANAMSTLSNHPYYSP